MSASDELPSPEQLQELADRHLLERPTWAWVALTVQQILDDIARELGFAHSRRESRSKDTGSLLGKALRRNRVEIQTFHDLAGARFLVPFGSQLGSVIERIKAEPRLEVLEIDLKPTPPNELAYSGIHLDVRLLDDTPGHIACDPPVDDLRCEIQVKTFAQSLWSELSHLVTYKHDVSEDVQRRVLRLVSLCELVDSEIEGAMSTVKAEQNPLVDIVDILEKWYFALSGRQYDRESTLAFTSVLADAVTEDELGSYSEAVDHFADVERERLTLILGDRPEVRGIALLLRPEAILVFERIANRPMSFRDFWLNRFSEASLEKLEAVWGPS